jgi:drug/metabolite transporter (DMT)-like permease
VTDDLNGRDVSMEPGAGSGSLPGPTPWPPTRPAPPHEVRDAFRLWIANLVVGFAVGFIGGFITAVTAHPQGSTPRAPTNVGAVIGGLIGAALALGLVIFFLRKMRKGRNWARIVVTILAGINILQSIPNFLSGQGVALVTGVLAILLLGPATILLYRPASNAYFKSPNYA